MTAATDDEVQVRIHAPRLSLSEVRVCVMLIEHARGDAFDRCERAARTVIDRRYALATEYAEGVKQGGRLVLEAILESKGAPCV